MFPRRVRAMALSCGLVGFLPAARPAAAQPAAPPAAAHPARGLRDRAELEAYLDGVMTTALTDKHVAGATVSVVKDGALFFAKGYGFADVEKRKPVDPEKTLFRIGSISKLFTWTAVMQLVEQGKLDLKKDINEYLDFKIPATYPEPITLTHVLTHTPGLEEDGRDLFTEDPQHIAKMGVWLPAHMPKRVRPPGTFSSYSNWATATAGYIVERTSGTPWDKYIEDHILSPLGMTQTTGSQPLPPRLEPDMSQGYQWKGGKFESHKWEIITGAAPAGSVSASATDMAKFMIAHLNNGAIGDQRILKEETAKLMHSRLQGHDPRLPGFAHGFYEQSSHGLRIIGHGGDTQWFHSDLALLLDEKVGVFVSFNTDKGSQLSFKPFVDAFLDHYYPEPLAVITPTAGAKQGAARYAGEYLFNRMNFSTYQKALGLASPITVAAAPDGALLVATPFGDRRFVSVDSMLFRDVASGDLLSFRADDQGRITEGFLGMVPMMALDRQSSAHSPKLHQLILGFGLVMFAGILLAALIRFASRSAVAGLAVPGSIASGRRVMALVALLQIGFVLVVVALASKSEELFAGTPTLLKVGLVLPVLGLVLTLLALWLAVRQWRRGEGPLIHRLRHLGAVIVALAFFWSLNTWNLLGWKI